MTPQSSPMASEAASYATGNDQFGYGSPMPDQAHHQHMWRTQPNMWEAQARQEGQQQPQVHFLRHLGTKLSDLVFGGPVSPQSDVPNASEARSPASEQASEPRNYTYPPQSATYSPQPAPPEDTDSHSQQMPQTPVNPQENEASPSGLSDSITEAAVRTAVSPSEVDSSEEEEHAIFGRSLPLLER